MSLKRQVAASFFWVGLSQLAGRLLSFFTYLILAKLLTPSLFGLVGMATLAIAALQFFQDVGFDAALIYKREGVEEASNTAFLVVIAGGSLVCVIAIVAAPLVALFFREPAVTPIVRGLAFSVVIMSFGRVAYILLERELNFQRRIVPELSANVIGSGASIVLALAGCGVWSLVWGQLIRAAVSSGLVWLVTSWRPRLRFNPQVARELFRYGKHIVASQGLIFLITNVDNAVVGRYAGDTALGLYSFAYNLSNLPATQITGMVNQVMFPAFSRLGSDAAAARARYYLTTVRYVTWITAPIAAATILFAPRFVYGLYSATWAPAILPLQLLAVYGFIRSVAANMGNIFRSLGKPQWLTYIAAWRLTTMLIFLYPVTKRWGIDGVSALSAIVAVVDFFISAALVSRLVNAPLTAYAKMIAPTGLAALMGGLIAFGAYPYLGLPKTALNLLVAGVILMAVYAGLAWLLDRELRATAAAGGERLLRLYRERRAPKGLGKPFGAGEN
jgi:O-antigen/teichoic acid export membrane protein